MAELDELFGNEKQTTLEPYSKDDWIKQRNENRALAYEMLETATEELNNPDTVMSYLDIQSKFDRYSVSNALLVAYQNPEATRLCDSKTWQKNHVFINKGETGIIILEPGKEYTRDDGKTVTPYNAKKVFDISQTNARPRQQKTRTPDVRLVIKGMDIASTPFIHTSTNNTKLAVCRMLLSLQPAQNTPSNEAVIFYFTFGFCAYADRKCSG